MWLIYGSRPFYQLEKLAKYIKEEGYPELQEDEKCSGFYISEKLPITVVLSISGGYGGIRLNYCKDAHKKVNNAYEYELLPICEI